MNSKSLFIILGNHLFPIKFLNRYKKMNFFMAEDYYLCTYEKHHKLKIAFFLNSMRIYANELEKKNFNIQYSKLDNSTIKQSYEDKIYKIISQKNIKHIYFYEIEDKFFEEKIINFANKNKLNYTIIQSPMFLNSRIKFKKYLDDVAKPLMASFYKKQRIEMNILMDNNKKPLGGKWSFDEDNREKIPKNLSVSSIPKQKDTVHHNEILKLIEKYFSNHPGSADYYWLASSRVEAKFLLEDFIKTRFKYFGNYEDAVLKNNVYLFHSFLSPYLNNGLITPQEIIDMIFSKNINSNIPINSIEGFVRQIIGWREFVRGIYQNYSAKLEEGNFYNNDRKLTKDWYTGNTGIEPIDDAIKDILKYGYAHHIIRLMHLSNIMNLAGVHPKEIYKWFMEMFIDSSDWVMTPNVFGMGTFSDAGIFSTKPYICGSNYIIKMSDYKKGKWADIVDGLYWNFISKNIESIGKNPRMSFIKMSYRKLTSEKLKFHKDIAVKFIREKTI